MPWAVLLALVWMQHLWDGSWKAGADKRQQWDAAVWECRICIPKHDGEQ